MKLIIIKVGGSVITQKESNTPAINWDNLATMASQLGILKKSGSPKYVLIHGVGSFGHPIVKQSGIDKGINNASQLLAFAQTQYLQNKLNCLVVGCLHKNNINAIPSQLSAHAVMEKGRLIKLSLDAMRGMLSIGLVPVCFGVPAYDVKLGCSILSGDQIAPFLAMKLGANRIIEACDVDGIFDRNPKIDPAARLIPEIRLDDCGEIEKSLSGSLAIDVTGGMRQKFFELAVAARSGIPSSIVHFTKLASAIEGNAAGTSILAN
jgi:isopentenyl phosphate kinase